MKNSRFILALLALTLCGVEAAQTNSPALAKVKPVANPAPKPPKAFRVVDRAANSRLWQRESVVKGPDGKSITYLRQYTEVASGMCYQNAKGEWMESKEIIEPYAKGAIARQGQYQVIFANNLNSAGAIDLQSADGKRLRSNILGLVYHDRATGDAVMIAKVQDATGALIANNQVLYENAFNGIKADVRYTYKRGSFEQDVILREQPPTPESCGLNPATTELQVMTEFLNPPKEKIKEHPGRNGLPSDQDIDWGSTYLGRGRAFDLAGGESGKPANVSKEFTNVGGRKILLEKVTVKDIQAGLGRLPLHAGTKSKLLKTAFNNLTIPKTPADNATSGPMMLALSAPAQAGYVLDYIALNANQTDFTFQADMTYFVNGDVNLYGTTTIEGGTIIKYDTTSPCSLNVLGTVNCQTASYRPAIFTSYNDSSVGESVGGNGSAACSGAIALHIANDLDSDLQIYVYDDYGNYVATWDTVSAHGSSDYSFTAGLGQHYAFDSYDTTDWNEYYTDFWPTLNNGTIEVHPDSSVTFSETGDALCTQPPPPPSTALSLANGGNLHNIRISNLGVGLSSSANCTIQDAQFVSCGTAVQVENSSFYAGNILMSKVGTAFYGHNFHGTCEQLTLDQSTLVTDDPDGSATTSRLLLNNSLLTADGPDGVVPIVGTDHRQPDRTGVYQTVGAGEYYLAPGSPFRNAGVTFGVNEFTLVDIRSKTTYPPIVYAGTSFSTALTLSPQAQRDVDVPDLGYHYDPLDYIFGGCDLSAGLTLAAGTAVAWYQDYGSVSSSGQPYGISLNNGANLTTAGTVTQPCWITHYALVQEAANGAWNTHGWMSGIMFNGSGTTAIPQLNAQFTKWSVVPGLVGFYRDNWASGVAKAVNCEYYGEGMGSVAGYLTMYYTNCLFFRTFIGFDAQSASTSFTIKNCTFYNGFMAMGRHTWQATADWTIQNTAFDGTGFQFDDDFHGSSHTAFDHNAYNLANQSGLTYAYPWGPLVTGLEVDANDQNVTGYRWQTGPLGGFYLPPDSPLIDGGNTTADQLGLYHFTTQTNESKEINSQVDIGYHYVAADANGNPLRSYSGTVPDYLQDANGNGIFDAGDIGDWRNPDYDADGLPDWWEQQYFGNLSGNGATLDINGNSYASDFQNGKNPHQPLPAIRITGPTVLTGSQPVIQIAGYATIPLAGIKYDLVNSAGTFVDQTAQLINQSYDDSLEIFGTNYFQCYDVPLAPGDNQITIKTTDLDGNVLTKSFTYNYVTDTTPPNLSVIWPLDEAEIAGDTFTVEAHVDDVTATITGSITDENGDTYVSKGTVDRDGTVWIPGLPVSGDENTLTLTATDASGNTSTTVLSLSRSTATVTVNAVDASQLSPFGQSASVSGTVNDATLEVYVNGQKASVISDGSWTASSVPLNGEMTAIFNVALYPAAGGPGDPPPTDPGGPVPTVIIRPNDLSLNANPIGVQLSKQLVLPAVNVVSYDFKKSSTDYEEVKDLWGRFAYSVTTTSLQIINWTFGIGGFDHTHISPDGTDILRTLPPDLAGANVGHLMMPEHGQIGGATVDAKVALFTGGLLDRSGDNLYLVKVQAKKSDDSIVPVSQVQAAGAALSVDPDDATYGDIVVQAAAQSQKALDFKVPGLDYYKFNFQAEQVGVQLLEYNDRFVHGVIRSPGNDVWDVQVSSQAGSQADGEGIDEGAPIQSLGIYHDVFGHGAPDSADHETYASEDDILSESEVTAMDNGTYKFGDQQVIFVRDPSDSHLLHFYTVADTYGKLIVTLSGPPGSGYSATKTISIYRNLLNLRDYFSGDDKAVDVITYLDNRIDSSEPSDVSVTPMGTAPPVIMHRNLLTKTLISYFKLHINTPYALTRGAIDGFWGGMKSDYNGLAGLSALAGRFSVSSAERAAVIKEICSISLNGIQNQIGNALASLMGQAQNNSILVNFGQDDPSQVDFVARVYIDGYAMGFTTEQIIGIAVGAGAASKIGTFSKAVLSTCKTGQYVVAGVTAISKFKAGAVAWVIDLAKNNLVSQTVAKSAGSMVEKVANLPVLIDGKTVGQVMGEQTENIGAFYDELLKLGKPLDDFGVKAHARLADLLDNVFQGPLSEMELRGFVRTYARLEFGTGDYYDKLLTIFRTDSTTGQQRLRTALAAYADPASVPDKDLLSLLYAANKEVDPTEHPQLLAFRDRVEALKASSGGSTRYQEGFSGARYESDHPGVTLSPSTDPAWDFNTSGGLKLEAKGPITIQSGSGAFLADNIVGANIGNFAQAVADELVSTPANWVVVDTFGLSSEQQTALLQAMTDAGVTDFSRVIFQ